MEGISPSSLTLHLLHFIHYLLFFCPPLRLRVSTGWRGFTGQHPSKFWANFYEVTAQLKQEVLQGDVPCKGLLHCRHPAPLWAPRPARTVVPQLWWLLLLFKLSRDYWEPANVHIDVPCSCGDDGGAYCLLPKQPAGKCSQPPWSSTWGISPQVTEWGNANFFFFPQSELKSKLKKKTT